MDTSPVHHRANTHKQTTRDMKETHSHTGRTCILVTSIIMLKSNIIVIHDNLKLIVVYGFEELSSERQNSGFMRIFSLSLLILMHRGLGFWFPQASVKAPVRPVGEVSVLG